MNYKESKEILDLVNKSKRILLNCHRNPDPDSVGSALATYQVLDKMGKEVLIVCSSDFLYDRLDILDGYNKIRTGVDFNNYDFKDFDLFITLDSSSWDMVSGLKEMPQLQFPVIVIDHHLSNTRYGAINLVDTNSTSVGEVLYNVFQDWGIQIDINIATPLMAAIVGDTGSFRFPKSTYKTFEIAAELMKLGVDKDKIVFQIYQNDPLDLIKFYGASLSRVCIDKRYKFVWTAIPYSVYKKLNPISSARESTAALFAQNVEGTNFGIVLSEEEECVLSVSLRSRTGFDTTKIAVELGGGGHRYASGAKVRGLPFKESVKHVLKIARKYAK